MVKPKREPKKAVAPTPMTYRLWLALYFCLAAFTGLLLGVALNRPEDTVPVLAGTFLTLILFDLTMRLLMWSAITFHELGHVLAGWASGFRFISLEVMNLGLGITDKGLRFYVLKDRRAAGLALMTPKSSDRLLAKYRRFVIGGPIATTIGFLITLWIFLQCNFPRREDGIEVLIVYVVAISALYINTILFLSSFFPIAFKGMASDALILWQLRKSGPEQLRMLASVQIGEQIRGGIRAREWTDALVDALGAPSDATVLEMRGRYLRYYQLADRGQVEEAWNELCRAAELSVTLAKTSGFFKGLLESEKVFAASWWKRDAALARSLIPPEKPEHELVVSIYLRALATVALVEGQPEETMRLMQTAHEAGMKIVARYRIRSATDVAWNQDIVAEATAMLAKSSPS